MNSQSRLRGAYDIHIHCSPDVVPRAQDLVELAAEAREAGMAGVVLKDHTACTAGRAYALNRLYPDGPRFFGILALNPSVGGLNPAAAEAALREGARIIYFPTYGARYFLTNFGGTGILASFPMPKVDYQGLSIWDGHRGVWPEVLAILDLIAHYDAVLATGHLAPMESVALLRLAQGRGIRRTVVTHASEAITPLTIEQQMEAAARGAFIEHCLLAAVPGSAHVVPMQMIADQIRKVGIEHCIVSSDFGQVANGPIVAGFARYLDLLAQCGFTEDELHTLICHNPARLLAG
jgi:hypothetical protein